MKIAYQCPKIHCVICESEDGLENGPGHCPIRIAAKCHQIYLQMLCGKHKTQLKVSSILVQRQITEIIRWRRGTKLLKDRAHLNIDSGLGRKRAVRLGLSFGCQLKLASILDLSENRSRTKRFTK